MNCENCAKELSEKINYCPYCGYDLQKGNNKNFWTLEQVYHHWKKRHFRTLSNASIRNIRYAWSKLESLHKKRFSSIDVDEYQEVIDRNATSYSRQHQIRNVISLLCNYGLRYQIIPFNFGHYLIVDAAKGTPKNIFSDEQILKIAHHADAEGAPYAYDAQIVLCLIYTGLRPNELFNLRKKSVNIVQQYIVGGGKTAAGTNRMIPIPRAISSYISKWYGVLSDENDYLLQTENAAKIDLDNWRKRNFYPLLSKLKINPPYRYGESPYKPIYVPYSCRHTFASLSARAKMDKDVLCKIIGHTDPAFTQQVYIHQKIGEYREEMLKLENLIESFSL